MYEKLLEKLKQNQPLIHCITNPIAIHQSANAVLALGARPIMAEHPEEVSEITGTAQGLLMNLGNITDVRMESMKRSFETAREEKLPVVLDAVGVASPEVCSGITGSRCANSDKRKLFRDSRASPP